MLFCLVVLLRMAWLSMLWKSEALTTSEIAANLWAANDIHKGKKVKLRLTIEKEPKGYASKPTEFDDGFVIREWKDTLTHFRSWADRSLQVYSQVESSLRATTKG